MRLIVLSMLSTLPLVFMHGIVPRVPVLPISKVLFLPRCRMHQNGALLLPFMHCMKPVLMHCLQPVHVLLMIKGGLPGPHLPSLPKLGHVLLNEMRG